jgi:hypothetical protein
MDQVIIGTYYRYEILRVVVKPEMHVTDYLRILTVNDVTFSAGSTQNLNSAATANC